MYTHNLLHANRKCFVIVEQQLCDNIFKICQILHTFEHLAINTGNHLTDARISLIPENMTKLNLTAYI